MNSWVVRADEGTRTTSADIAVIQGAQTLLAGWNTVAGRDLCVSGVCTAYNREPA